MRAEQILDALVGAKAKPPDVAELSDRPRGFLQEALSAFGLGGQDTGGSLGRGVGDARSTLGDWTAKAKEAMGRNPTLTAGAIAAAAGLLLSGRGRALLGNVAGIGGIGLIGALAYNAFRKYQERKADAEVNPAALNPARATDGAADGRMDSVERERVTAGLREAGLDTEGARWLEQEFAKPASIEELAARSSSPEKAAQMYSAARLVVEPDTPEERAFLEKLAKALKLDPALAREIDGGASNLKVDA